MLLNIGCCKIVNIQYLKGNFVHARTNVQLTFDSEVSRREEHRELCKEKLMQEISDDCKIITNKDLH